MKNNNNLIVDIHAIQNIPPSNMNRDDTGSPKTAEYGGVTRSRVSSQAWKRVMREYFVEHMDEKQLGIRTLELVNYLTYKVQKIDSNVKREDALKKVEDVLKKLNFRMTTSKNSDDKHKVLNSLFFIGNTQAEQLAKDIVNGVKDKKKLSKDLQNNPSMDLALFGRMLASNPTLNQDASAQVSHAISTHAVQNEFDFFTAVDDFSKDPGAAMLGTTEFDSFTAYRYANIAGHELLHQLNNNVDKTIQTIKLFIESFVKSIPSGHITSFANDTLPEALVVTVRDDRPVNLVGGFETPVKSNAGYVTKSINRLNDEFNKNQRFVNKPKLTLTIGVKDKLNKNKTTFLDNDQNNLNDLLDNLANQIKPLLSKNRCIK